MNILPHKSWHVRTKANIARVRKDQAKAAEEEAEKQRRVAVADYEARINLLRKRSHQPSETQTSESEPNEKGAATEIVSTSQHVDLFADHEEKQKKVKPMDEEKRQEQEKYEKQIGYLTYLGQDTHESLGTQSWYNTQRERDSQKACDESGEKIEIGLKSKHLHDPMFQFLKKPFSVEKKKTIEKIEKIETPRTKRPSIEPLATAISSDKTKRRRTSSEKKHKRSKSRKKSSKEKKKKHKTEKRKRKRSSSRSSSSSGGGDSDSASDSEEMRQIKLANLQKLREQRLQRERQEQNKTKDFLRSKFPSLLPPEEVKKPENDGDSNTEQPRMPLMKQKYNSQFNPFLAKQNYSN